MFSQQRKLKGLFTLENFNGVEFLWVWIPGYRPQSPTRFIAMIFFALALTLLPFKRKAIGAPTEIIVSSMSIFPVPIAIILKKLLYARKFIFEVRDLWPLTPIHLMNYSPNHVFIKLLGAIEKMGYRNSDHIVSLLGESHVYIDKISQKPAKFVWIPNGIDDKVFDYPSSHSSPLPLYKSEGRMVVGYVGTLGYANAMQPFFDFLKNQGSLEQRIQFVVIGDGYLKQTYEDNVKGISNVEFVGKVKKEQVREHINALDICFIAWHPSKLYEYGVSANKYFDYMAAAKPILSAQTGISDPVVKAQCGLIVENTSEGICSGLTEFLSMSEHQRKKMGGRGREYVRNNHLYSVLAKKYIDVFESTENG